MKKNIFIYCLMTFALICFIMCENPIMKKWWVEPEPKEPEVEYVPIVKMIPQVTHDTVYETIYQEVIKFVPEYICETIIEYQTEYVTVYEEVIKEVEKIVTAPPADEQIKEYIINNIEKVIEIINNDSECEKIIEKIIEKIPPEKIVDYLTTEQIKYILEQQPPQVILQTITIIDIEYIIFAGDSRTYNGPHGPGAATDLTSQEKSSNDASVKDMAQALLDHSDYLIMLHGHANPVNFTDGETVELMQLSMDRANSVEAKLKTTFTNPPINGNINNLNDRVSVSGYGGEKNLFGSNSTYAGLNRRVEMILVRVGI